VEALVEALIEEARRRARRRRQRTLVVVLAAMLGALWLYSHLGTGGAGSEAVVASGTPGASASRPKATLPEELSFSANRGVVLVRRDGTRRPFVSEIIQPHAGRHRPFYNGLDWSPDGSKLLTLRGGNGFGRALVVTDKTGKVISTLDSRALDGGWSTDGTRIAFVRYEEGLGRLLFVASSDGRAPTRIAAHVKSFGYPAFSWSPHGTKLAYAPQGASGLMIADATGHRDPRPVPIATGAGAPGLKIATVQWSPDGSLIAFTSDDDPSDTHADWHVNVVHPDGTSFRRVADGDGFDWSPDGKRLAIEETHGRGGVFVVNADGTICIESSVAAVTCAAKAPARRWSPGRSTARGSRTSAAAQTP
jgi:Tol biopolymer transport system component